MEVGNQIKKFRKIAGLTQKELAEKSNISRSYLADVENNRYNPSLETLKAIARSLDVTLGELVSENKDLTHAVEDFYYSDDQHKKDIEDNEKAQITNTDITLAAHRINGYDEPLTEDEVVAVEAYLKVYREQKKKG